MKRLLPFLLLAAPAGAQIVRAVPSEAAVAGVSAAAAISAAPALLTGGFGKGVVLSAAAAPGVSGAAVPNAAAASAAAPAAASADPQAALVEKIGARLCGMGCVDRRKNAQWIGEIAAQHPREPVQAAAVRVLGDDAVRANDLSYFEAAASAIESFAGATEYDAVFEAAVRRLVAAARTSGGAQSRTALHAAERLGAAGTPARRARAAALVAELRGTSVERADPDALERTVARLAAPAPAPAPR
jgi:hypothetical protein